jgi:flagellar basal-body rod protein FlgB
VLAGNLVNADTPGYRRVDLHFDAALDAAAKRLNRTHPGHLSLGGGPHGADYRLEAGPRGTRPDGNGVDLDYELVQVSRNAGAFKDRAAVLGRILALRHMAISGR